MSDSELQLTAPHSPAESVVTPTFQSHSSVSSGTTQDHAELHLDSRSESAVQASGPVEVTVHAAAVPDSSPTQAHSVHNADPTALNASTGELAPDVQVKYGYETLIRALHTRLVFQ